MAKTSRKDALHLVQFYSHEMATTLAYRENLVLKIAKTVDEEKRKELIKEANVCNENYIMFRKQIDALINKIYDDKEVTS